MSDDRISEQSSKALGNGTPILRMEGISKAFPGVQALDDVDLEVKKGAVHAICGENGAGKSTLMKILAGAYKKDSGRIFVRGEETEIHAPRDSLELGIAVIYQEFTLVPQLTVAENILLGNKDTLRNGFVDWKQMYSRAGELIESLGASIPVGRRVGSLSVPEQQIVEIAKALARNAKIIVMDEPSAVLGDRDLDRFFEIVGKLTALETTILYVSHRLKEVFQISDTITVLKDGKLVGTHPTNDLTTNDLVKMMVGREIGFPYPTRKRDFGDVILDVGDLRTNTGVNGVSFNLRSGEIVGIAGLVGAGRTEIARALFGADPITSGTVTLHGIPLPNRVSLRRRIVRGVGLLPEDRKAQGLFLRLSVATNITIASLRFKPLVRAGKISLATEREVVSKFIKRMGIRTPNQNTRSESLSGGNQQKVVFAKWLAAKADVLIVDEPTRGVDVSAKQEIYEILDELTAEGKGVLMISSELPEVLGMCDRIYVVHDGLITGELSREDATEAGIMTLATGSEHLIG